MIYQGESGLRSRVLRVRMCHQVHHCYHVEVVETDGQGKSTQQTADITRKHNQKHNYETDVKLM